MTEANEKREQVPSPVKHEDAERNGLDHNVARKIELNAEFSSFLELRSSIDRYQKDKSVQLIVKDSKLLKAESTRRVIPKVYHLVNQKLMYHSITYCCKCHGEPKQRIGIKVIKNVGKKRLNCPMYIRFKLSPDLQKLVLFDLDETHNHGVDPTTCQMTPRQQVYRLSKMKRGTSVDDDNETNTDQNDINGVSRNDKKDGTDYKPPRKSARIQARRNSSHRQQWDISENSHDSDSEDNSLQGEQQCELDSPLDSDSSCSDSDEEEMMKNRALLPFPVRLIGSAIQSSPELLAATKQLIEIQISKLVIEKQKLILETKQLELTNSKLELEIKVLERTLTSEMTGSSEGRDTTIYLQAT